MTLTRDEQIARLSKTGSLKLLKLAKPGFVFITGGFIITGAITGNPVFYAAAAAAGLLTLAVWVTAPHIHNAAQGLSEGVRQNGEVEIGIHLWPDGEREHESYRGLISMNRQPLWEMDFAQPAGWTPVIGKQQATLVFIRGISWPVVLILENGLLYPGGKPRRAGG